MTDNSEVHRPNRNHMAALSDEGGPLFYWQSITYRAGFSAAHPSFAETPPLFLKK